jgi:hypothetical protein
MKEENTLTAKEWLVSKLGNPGGKYTEEQEINIWMMEQYANYKNRILEDRIKEFKDNLLTIKQSLLDYREVDAKEEVDLLLKNMTNILE